MIVRRRMPARASGGFTYIGLLVLVAVMGMSLTVVAEIWRTAQQRDQEEELLFIGNQFRHAIAMYAANSASYPRNLEDLVKDPTFPGVRRYLRKIYRDPITGKSEWGLVKSTGEAIIGVYSLSEREPFKKGGFSLADQAFEGKTKYSDWVFAPKAVQGTPGIPMPPGTGTPPNKKPPSQSPSPGRLIRLGAPR